MDRASDYGSEGWGFNSLRARHHHMGHPAAIQDLKARLAGGPAAVRLWGAGGSGDIGGQPVRRVGADGGHARPEEFAIPHGHPRVPPLDLVQSKIPRSAT